MRLGDLHPREGSRKQRKRVGRGRATGSGKTSGRGQKGQGSRSGGGVRPGFEGGQTPLQMRTPKLRGANKARSRKIGIFRKTPAIVNVGELAVFPAGTVVTHELLAALGVCRDSRDGLRVLGSGELEVALTVQADHFSASARQKLEAAGGTCVLTSVAAAE